MSTESTTLKLPEPSEPVNMSEVHWVKLNYKWAHQPEDMHLECAFDSQHQAPCNVSKEVSWAMAPEGLCHTFNSQQTLASMVKELLLDLEGSMGSICSSI